MKMDNHMFFKKPDVTSGPVMTAKDFRAWVQYIVSEAGVQPRLEYVKDIQDHSPAEQQEIKKMIEGIFGGTWRFIQQKDYLDEVKLTLVPSDNRRLPYYSYMLGATIDDGNSTNRCDIGALRQAYVFVQREREQGNDPVAKNPFL